MLNYVHDDMATEYLVYAHGSPEIKRALDEIDHISERTVGDRNIVVAYDDESSWPLSWYMRLYPNSKFYASNPTSDVMTAPVIIVGPKNYESVRPYVARDYVKRAYRRIWWPDQGYFNLTPQQVFAALQDREQLKRILDIVFYRRYRDENDPTQPRDLTQWPTRSDFEMYVRRDIAEEIWDLSVLPVASTGGNVQTQLREREIPLSASMILDAEYDGLGLLTPRAVAVSPDGRIVVADSGNHRIVVLDSNGQLQHTFGSLCRLGEGEAGGCMDPDGSGPLLLGDGQFNEPWGVAVDPDGNIYVADTWNGRIQAFDPDGTFQRSWGYFNTTDGELGDPFAMFGPRGIAVDPDGELMESQDTYLEACTWVVQFVAEEAQHSLENDDAQPEKELAEAVGEPIPVESPAEGVAKQQRTTATRRELPWTASRISSLVSSHSEIGPKDIANITGGKNILELDEEERRLVGISLLGMIDERREVASAP